MKRIWTIAPVVMLVALCVGLSWVDAGCTPSNPKNDGTTNDAGPTDQAKADTAQPQDQAAADQSAPDQAPPKDEGKPDQAAPDKTPVADQSAPDQTPPKDEGKPDQAPPTDQGAPDQTPPPPGIKVSGSVGAPKFTGGFDPLADAKVCVFQKPAIPCVKSDSAGKFALPGVPKNAETGLVISKAAHVPFVLTFATKEADMNFAQMLAVTPKSTLDGLGLLLGTSVDYSKGLLAGAISDAQSKGLSGASVAMTPNSGDGPFYMNDSGIPDKQRKDSSSRGQYIWINVNPGSSVEIAVTHATNKKCTSDGWKGATAGTAKIPVVAGHMVAAGITCTP